MEQVIVALCHHQNHHHHRHNLLNRLRSRFSIGRYRQANPILQGVVMKGEEVGGCDSSYLLPA